MTSGGTRGTVAAIIYGNSKESACFGFSRSPPLFFSPSPLSMNVDGKSRRGIKVD